MRAFTVLLLRDRDYPLWQRIFLLGMFCKRLHEITDAHQVELVPQLLQEHSELIATGKLRGLMEGIPARTAMQLATVLEIIKRHLDTTAGKHPRFRDCVKDFLKGIHCEEGAPIEDCASFFEEADTRYCSPFLTQHPYMLENFLLNYIFRTRFPYGQTPRGVPNDPLTEFLMLCILFTLIKELMVGTAGLHRESFDASHVVKIVQSVSKSVEQCPKFPLANYVSLANADGMALLLKNIG
ncbi:MAG TPA: flagellin lysine-N-methylase [Terriglobales bacterium]|nr:flagellin lysine-N-methylase [Terriglobales bacterium]